MAREWERQFGLVYKSFCGDQGGEMGDGRAGTGLSDMLQDIFYCRAGRSSLHVHYVHVEATFFSSLHSYLAVVHTSYSGKGSEAAFQPTW